LRDKALVEVEVVAFMEYQFDNWLRMEISYAQARPTVENSLPQVSVKHIIHNGI
jgi:hypothetical protein